MTRVLGSRRTFCDEDDEKALTFIETVADITTVKEYRELMHCRQHHATSRYQHCLNVAWYSYLMARKAGLDYRSCARGAMLHDFYLYDWHKGTPLPGRHCAVHPRIALMNAEKYFKLNDIEKDCIVHHMWPNGTAWPKTKEGMIITIADKYCAALEFCSHGALQVPYYVAKAYKMIME